MDKVARQTGFVARKGKIDAATFLSFNSFLGEDICEKPLTALSAKLASHYNVLLSPQALNERFNDNSVDYMKEVFRELMLKQNKILEHNYHFNRIVVNDSTIVSLPERFASEFKGVGGNSKSSAKIQLQYDLLSGNFICCEVMSGSLNDGSFIDKLDRNIQPGDLRLADLGYYKVGYLRNISDKGAFYVSKIKSTTPIYVKNLNAKKTKKGKIIKSSEYTRLNALDLIKPLADGETIEIKDIYIGSKKELKTRLIITKLSEKDKQIRDVKNKQVLKREKREINERNSGWTGLNAYITNVPEEILAKKQVHDIYSLRWQVEIMFKIWKSVFKISNIKYNKKIKIQRFKCFLYGRLISMLFSSGIVFAAKDVIRDENLDNYQKELSELKAFRQVREFFPNISIKIFEGEISILIFINAIMNLLRRFAIKSIRKGDKCVIELLDYVAIKEDDEKITVI